MSTTKALSVVAIVAGQVMFASSVAAAIIAPPGLNFGDPFHIIMVTTATRNATSTDIADYNSFVNADAAANGVDTYQGQAVQWFAVGSTPHRRCTGQCGRDGTGLSLGWGAGGHQ